MGRMTPEKTRALGLQIKQEIEQRGIVMLGEYVNAATKVLFRCGECAHEWSTEPGVIRRGSGCPQCAYRAKFRPTMTKEKATENFADRGITMLTEYTSYAGMATFRCKFGHEWETAYRNVQVGGGCPDCTRLNTDTYNVDLSGRGITLIEPYTKSSDRLLFRCECGNEWRAAAYAVRAGSGCPVCSFKRQNDGKRITLDVIEARAAKVGFTIRDYIDTHTKATFTCANGHEWAAVACDVLAGKAGCPHCAGRAKLTADDVNARLLEKGIRLIGEYTGANIKTAFACQCGHEFEAQPASLYSRDITGCPKCCDRPTIHGAERGFLYVLTIGELTKIGITSSPAARLQQLRWAYPSVELVALFDAGTGKEAFALEQLIHQRYAQHNAGLRGHDGATELFTVPAANAVELILTLGGIPVIVPTGLVQ